MGNGDFALPSVHASPSVFERLPAAERVRSPSWPEDIRVAKVAKVCNTITIFKSDVSNFSSVSRH